MKVRILREQEYHHSQPDRKPLASGAEVDLPQAWAKELLQRGEAEPVAQKRASGAEKRPGGKRSEKRG
jgi:hypothetical protein